MSGVKTSSCVVQLVKNSEWDSYLSLTLTLTFTVHTCQLDGYTTVTGFNGYYQRSFSASIACRV